MRQEAEHFGEQELNLVYVARKLKDAMRLEDVLTKAGLDYYVEPDQYISGTILKRQRVGAFFYVLPDIDEAVRRIMRESGFEPYTHAS